MSFSSFFDKMFWLLLGAIPFLLGLIYRMGNQLLKSEFKEEIKKLENKLILLEEILMSHKKTMKDADIKLENRLDEMETTLNSLKKHEKNNSQHTNNLLQQILERK
jgi:hypothetical protein